MKRVMIRAVACWALLGGTAHAQPSSGQDFQAWLQAFRGDALARGIRAETLDEILPTITEQRQAVREDRNQAEFVQTYARYLERVSPWRVDTGRRLLREQGAMLREASRAHGVQERFALAILGLESNYGSYPITEPLFSVVATLAFDGRRGELFRSELLAAFEIVDKGYATFDMMKSSWAGALGVAQFTPSNFLRLAVDHDADGTVDLWSLGPDAVASVANYLKNTGWRDDQTWGREVHLPPGGEQSLPALESAGVTPARTCASFRTLGAWRPLSEWQALGVRRDDGGDLPARDLPAALIIGDEGDDRGYLVYRNFCSLMRYNPSFRYALSVGLLADALGE